MDLSSKIEVEIAYKETLFFLRGKSGSGTGCAVSIPEGFQDATGQTLSDLV